MAVFYLPLAHHHLHPLLVCLLVSMVHLLLVRLPLAPLVLLVQATHYSLLYQSICTSVSSLLVKLLVLITSRPRCSSRSVLTSPTCCLGSSPCAVNGLTFLLSGGMLKSIRSSRKVILRCRPIIDLSH